MKNKSFKSILLITGITLLMSGITACGEISNSEINDVAEVEAEAEGDIDEGKLFADFREEQKDEEDSFIVENENWYAGGAVFQAATSKNILWVENHDGQNFFMISHEPVAPLFEDEAEIINVDELGKGLKYSYEYGTVGEDYYSAVICYFPSYDRVVVMLMGDSPFAEWSKNLDFGDYFERTGFAYGDGSGSNTVTESNMIKIEDDSRFNNYDSGNSINVRLFEDAESDDFYYKLEFSDGNEFWTTFYDKMQYTDESISSEPYYEYLYMIEDMGEEIGSMTYNTYTKEIEIVMFENAPEKALAGTYYYEP